MKQPNVLWKDFKRIILLPTIDTTIITKLPKLKELLRLGHLDSIFNLKNHKHGHPGRPVISSVNCHTLNILKYINYHLKLIVQRMLSYMQDTSDFYKKLAK